MAIQTRRTAGPAALAQTFDAPDSTLDSVLTPVQADRLADDRLQTAQRRALAAQIGQTQGNRHLQRMVGSLDGKDARAMPPQNGRVGAAEAKAGPDRAYDVELDQEGAAGVRFGEGKTGARPPTGRGAAVASYQQGAGAAGGRAPQQAAAVKTKEARAGAEPVSVKTEKAGATAQPRAGLPDAVGPQAGLASAEIEAKGARATTEGGMDGLQAAAAGPKSPTSPMEDPGFQSVVGDLKGMAAGLQAHAPASAKSKEAQDAAVSPPNEMEGKAKARHVEKMDRQQPKPFDRAGFLSALMSKILAIAPKTLSEADRFAKSGKVGSVKNELTGQVAKGKQKAQDSIERTAKEAPDASGLSPKKSKALSPVAAGASPEVDASQAAPKSKTAPEVEAPLQESSDTLDQQMSEADITEEQLAKSNEPEFQGALEAKKGAQAHAATAPQGYRESEKAILAQAKAGAQTGAQAGVEGMHGLRGQLLPQVAGLQGQAKGKDEQARSQVASHIEGIYAATKQKVKGILGKLDGTVNQRFDAGAKAAKRAFEGYVDRRMKAYKRKRYKGVWGKGKWVKDKLLGMPSAVNAFYQKGRDLYVAKMKGTLEQIATVVETGLTETKATIAKGKQKVTAYVNSLPQSLQQVGLDSAQEIQGRFDELEQGVADKQNALVDSLAEKYESNLKQLDAQIGQMKKANRGLVGAALDKLSGVIQTVKKLKDMLLSVVKGAASVITGIIKDPIGFLKKLLGAVKLGFKQFVGNIWKHLKAGFLAWLFGALAGAGIEIPETFDLKGIFGLVLQVLGLTAEAIKARVGKIIGEKNVERIEKVWGFISALISGGLGGLWKYAKDYLGDLKAMVVDQVKSWLIKNIITRAVLKLVSMFNPVGAFIQACMTIYNVIMFIVERAQQLKSLVEAITKSVAMIVKGGVKTAAGWIESALARAIPVAIGFLARLLGLGGIGATVKGIITKARNKVGGVIDKVIKKVAGFVKGIFGRGKAEARKAVKATPEQKKKVRAGLAAIDVGEKRYLKDGKISRKDAERVAVRVKQAHPVFASIKVVDGGNTWDYDYAASPGKRKPGEEKGDELPTLVFTRSSFPNIAKNIRAALNEGKPEVLTRLAGRSKIRANRRAALRGAPRPAAGMSLDEYPMASTHEGGAGSRVMAVPANEQNSQGGTMSSFYQKHKLVDGDKFRVKVG